MKGENVFGVLFKLCVVSKIADSNCAGTTVHPFLVLLSVQCLNLALCIFVLCFFFVSTCAFSQQMNHSLH